MLYEAKSLINLPIISLDSGRILGSATDIIIDPENGKLLGLLSISGFLSSKKATAFNDIYECNADAILVKDDESVVNIAKLVRIEKVVGQKIFLLKNKVVTESGKRLGRVSDFVINIDLGILVKIYVEDYLWKGYSQSTLVVPAHNIVSIEHKKIIVNDDVVGEKIEEGKTMKEPVIT